MNTREQRLRELLNRSVFELENYRDDCDSYEATECLDALDDLIRDIREELKEPGQ